MAGDGEDLEDRTEEASQHRRSEWRKDGKIVQSKELTGSLLALSLVAVMYGFSGWFYRGIAWVFETSYNQMSTTATGDFSIEYVISALSFVYKSLVFVGAPIMIATVVVGILGSVAQFGVLFTTKPMEMDVNKLNPLNGWKKIASVDGFFEFIKAIVKLCFVSAVSYFLVSQVLAGVGMFWGAEPGQILQAIGYNSTKVLAVVASTMLVISLGDFMFQKYRHEQKIKMTKEEAKQERKQQDGSPQVKARIRSLQRSIATRKMMVDVKGADVVVTNPTHFAVALKYDRTGMAAPRVVAKGVDAMALRIKRIAKEAGVPVVENPPLARALYRALKIGQFISRELYNAVAEVLAYVYRLKGMDNL